MVKDYSTFPYSAPAKMRAARHVKTSRALASILFTGIAIVGKLYLLSALNRGEKRAPVISELTPHRIANQRPTAERLPSLKVMTLNAAHGRKDGSHQLLQKRAAIKANLNDIALILKREKPDIVALQETDGPSAWSGGFDHVRHLAHRAEYPFSVRGEHVKGKRNVYGTALLSALPLHTPVSIRFSPSPPTFSKGAVISTIQWPGSLDLSIDVISVHLDFARKSIRKKQARELVDRLKAQGRPLIVMGDFNCELTSSETTLPFLTDKLGLEAYRPEAKDLHTYPLSGRRLDWILTSPELEFSNYSVFHDTLSDHLGVVAELRLADRGLNV